MGILIFNLQELARVSKVDYFRLYHVSRGNRKEGFTDIERQRLEKAIIAQVNKALEEIGSHKAVTSLE